MMMMMMMMMNDDDDDDDDEDDDDDDGDDDDDDDYDGDKEEDDDGGGEMSRGRRQQKEKEAAVAAKERAFGGAKAPGGSPWPSPRPPAPSWRGGGRSRTQRQSRLPKARPRRSGRPPQTSQPDAQHHRRAHQRYCNEELLGDSPFGNLLSVISSPSNQTKHEGHTLLQGITLRPMRSMATVMRLLFCASAFSRAA